jgi:glycyl-tRNA synthetase beta chain
VPLEKQAAKLDQIVFHEKLGTVADKVERVAKLARWLVEEGIVKPSPPAGEGRLAGGERGEGKGAGERALTLPPGSAGRAPPSPAGGEGLDLAALAERAARLAKADLVTGLVGEFPELQGVIGGHLARAQGEPPEVADAIRDHYKPVGQGDGVPTAPVTVAVSLADKLDTLAAFFVINELPTGSKDPFALRRAMLGFISLVLANKLRMSWKRVFQAAAGNTYHSIMRAMLSPLIGVEVANAVSDYVYPDRPDQDDYGITQDVITTFCDMARAVQRGIEETPLTLNAFVVDRLKVQQREAGVRHDLIDAVFALGGEDDLVRLLGRVKALQDFVEKPEGADLLAGYKRAANILRAEEKVDGHPARPVTREIVYHEIEPAEDRLLEVLNAAGLRAHDAIEREAFQGAMEELAKLRTPIDEFFDQVLVNDPDELTRAERLGILARFRDAVHQVADFSRIEG